MNIEDIDIEFKDMCNSFIDEIRFSYIDNFLYIEFQLYVNYIYDIVNRKDNSILGYAKLISRNMIIQDKINKLRGGFALCNSKHRFQNMMEENASDKSTIIN